MNHPQVKLETSRGSIVLELFPEHAPKTVENFLSLVKKSFYDGLVFHRAIPGFIIQTGCPKGDGTGNPGYTIPCECQGQTISHDKPGVVAMAHGGKDTGGSQFYITLAPHPHLDNTYTIFGQVEEGLEVVHRIVVGDTVERAFLLSEDAPTVPEEETISSEEEGVESAVAEGLEPMDEISQMMDRIKAALEVAGIGSTDKAAKNAPVLSQEEKIVPFPDSDIVGAIEELESVSISTANESFASGLEEAIQKSKANSTDIESEQPHLEAETPSEPLEAALEAYSRGYSIEKIKGAMLGDIQELSGMHREEKTPSDATEAIREQLEAGIEDQLPIISDHSSISADLSTADEISTEIDELPVVADEAPIKDTLETIEDLREANRALQETKSSLEALARTSTQTVIALQLIGILLAGILALEIIAVLARGDPNVNVLRHSDLLFANVAILLGTVLLWLVISAILLSAAKFLFSRRKE